MTLICIICRSSQTAIDLRLPRMRVRRRGAIECRVDTPAIPRRTLRATHLEVVVDDRFCALTDQVTRHEHRLGSDLAGVTRLRDGALPSSPDRGGW